MRKVDVAVIGAGPAGLAAGLAAKKAGAEKVVIIERDFRPGGILEQCIHTGFGLKYFGEQLSGPEYAQRFIEKVEEAGVELLLNSMVLSIDAKERIISYVNSSEGEEEIQAGGIVLAMGCRERTRGAIRLPGTRPAGIYTAGVAQRFANVQNYIVGKSAVILGSGDIGMIMARRMTLENVEVKAVVELMPYLAGLTRNKVQCLDDFNIPLYLGHTITNVKGKKRVESVTVAKVDDKGCPVESTSFEIPCDTLLLSVGLIPENELSKACGIKLDPITNGPVVDSRMQTNVPGIFACGNVLHVNDLVDNVSEESENAGRQAARFAMEKKVNDEKVISVNPGNGVRYVVPQQVVLNEGEGKINLFFRVRTPGKNVHTCVRRGDKILSSKKRVRVNPGEMESLALDISKLEGTADNIEVFLEED